MTIDKLSSETKSKYVTISLSYDEVSDIANGLYTLQKIGKPEDVEKYKEAFVNMHFVFDIVKHGMVQPISVRNMYELGNSKKAKKSG